MKKQNCILKTYKGGKVTNFERFTCKRAETVISQYKKNFAPCDFDGFFFREYREADTIKIIATPDGCREGDTLAEMTPQEFFERIA